MSLINKKYLSLEDTNFYKVLDNDGNLIDKNYKQVITDKDLLKAYKYMVLSRKQDEYMLQLQRQGRMLTFAPNLGEEALQVAVAIAMKKEDWFVPAFRSNAAMLLLGVPLINMFYYWNGNEKGSKFPKGVNVLPVNIPIATQCSHAVGVAYGMKIKKVKGVSVSFIGNGGTAEGEFYEAMNIAAIHKLPTVFCINNNQWAISTPNKYETATKTYAIKGTAAGVPGIRVDGNDLLASYEAAHEAITYAREGNGPVVIEFITWRQGPHTTSDNPAIYRTKEEEKKAEVWEPFHRIEKYLVAKKLMTQKEIDNLKNSSLEEVKKVYQKSLEDIEVSVDEVFDFTYEKLPHDLEQQKEELKEEMKELQSE